MGFAININDAIRQRIKELVDDNKTTLTTLCLNSNLTPSTIFDFMAGKSQCPKVSTIKKLCFGAGIKLKDFFDSPLFENLED